MEKGQAVLPWPDLHSCGLLKIEHYPTYLQALEQEREPLFLHTLERRQVEPPHRRAELTSQ